MLQSVSKNVQGSGAFRFTIPCEAVRHAFDCLTCPHARLVGGICCFVVSRTAPVGSQGFERGPRFERIKAGQ